MDMANLLTYDTPSDGRNQTASEPAVALQEQPRPHQYPTRYAALNNGQGFADHDAALHPADRPSDQAPEAPPMHVPSPPSPTPKNIAFELLFEGHANYRARLPMRVQIFPHDTTDSIVTTVKNFYGLYEGTAKFVSFEDQGGNTLIARYENFKNNMVVYVRVVPDNSQPSLPMGQLLHHATTSGGIQRINHPDETPLMLPPQPAQALNYGQSMSRPLSRAARKRSVSPRAGRNHRSSSTQKGRAWSGVKSQEASAHGNLDETNSDAINGYSSSDGGAGSLTGSRKARSEQLASAEISLDNIVEGGRRKRAKFESSELPLFVPPQVPAPNSVSSISPQRRSNGQEHPSPFARPTPRNLTSSQPLQSPQGYGSNELSHGVGLGKVMSQIIPLAQHSHRLRDRVNAPHNLSRVSTTGLPWGQGIGILPTPDPTIASCISDEDVALQLMRLGDASIISHGRTSASTLDETLSGRADAASSATSESGDESDNKEQPVLPRGLSDPQTGTALPCPDPSKKRYKHDNDGVPSVDSNEPSGEDADEDYQIEEKENGESKSDPNGLASEHGPMARPKVEIHKGLSGGSKTRLGRTKIISKNSKSRVAPKKVKTSTLSAGFKTPISPASVAPQSRKNSSASILNFQHQLGADEEDLSSKPRCQRCRKSKKGCDRQRPCQRCQDAGIGVEGCISEDEGNGRKGRFGRHMGVSVKKESFGPPTPEVSELAATTLSSALVGSEKNKKRKR